MKLQPNEFTCPRCGQIIRIITVDDKGKEIKYPPVVIDREATDVRRDFEAEKDVLSGERR